MVKELASHSSHETSPAESASVARLHSQALSELSVNTLQTNNNDVQKSADSVSASFVQPSQTFENSVQNQLSSASLESLTGLIVTGLNEAVSEARQSVKLTNELKSAVDNASKIVVKQPSRDTTGSDIVIKQDGTIIHYLDLDSKANGTKTLKISIEKGSNPDAEVTAEQAETLKELLSFVKARAKNISVESPVKSPSATETGNPTRDTSSWSNPNNADVPENQSSQQGYEPVRQSPGAQSRSSDQSHDYSTGDNTGYSPTQQRDWTQVNLFDLFMEWFSTDPETFKKLMPGLFKKIAGADGKIDPKKLRQLVKSNDPLLSDLKNQLPTIAEAFPSANRPAQKPDSGRVSSSGDAVNATGAVLADKAAQVSDELPGSGYCATGVSYAIERATGKVIWGNANDMRQSLPEQGFTVAQSKDLKVGQVVHVYWTREVYAQEQARRGPCPNYGDIAVIGKGKDGQLYAYNDAATPLNEYLQKSRYDWNTLKVFNPPGV